MVREIYNFYLFILAGVLLGMSSCSVSSVSMRVLVPAHINVPQHIQKVAIANRSLPDKKGTFKNVLEGFITGESILADREGSELCIKGLASKLSSAPRFQPLLIEGSNLRGTGTRQFPVPLDWAEVESVCNTYNADALITLETFDSNIGIKKGSKVRKRKKDGKEIEYTEFFADLRVNVRAGWRIYDPKNRRIVDESTFTDEKGWSGKGENPRTALSRLPSKRSAINDAGFFSGEMFGIRISPTWMGVSRQYFVKGHDDLKNAKSYVKRDNWKAAAEIWKKLAYAPDPKVAGRANYNMALAAEMEGNLEVALDWAKKAYHDFGVKRAREYVNIINRRIMDQQRLHEQMGD